MKSEDSASICFSSIVQLLMWSPCFFFLHRSKVAHQSLLQSLFLWRIFKRMHKDYLNSASRPTCSTVRLRSIRFKFKLPYQSSESCDLLEDWNNHILFLLRVSTIYFFPFHLWRAFMHTKLSSTQRENI